MEIKTSGTDYSVIYGEYHFKGFEIQIGGLNMIQLELQPEAPTVKNIYLFVKYELTPDGLTYCKLNHDVVSAHCQTPEELMADLFVHWNNPFLFSEPIKFTKSSQK